MKNSNILGREVSCEGIAITAPYTVKKAWWNPTRRLFILLMEFFENAQEKRFRNLAAYDDYFVWTAELPKGLNANCYTDAHVNDDNISAFSFSGYRCSIDPSDGRILSSIFAK